MVDFMVACRVASRVCAEAAAKSIRGRSRVVALGGVALAAMRRVFSGRFRGQHFLAAEKCAPQKPAQDLLIWNLYSKKFNFAMQIAKTFGHA